MSILSKIIQSKNFIYVGITNNLPDRIKTHNQGKVYSTRIHRPFKLIYYEAHHNKYDAAEREKFLETGWGKNWIKRTLQHYFSQNKD